MYLRVVIFVAVVVLLMHVCPLPLPPVFDQDDDSDYSLRPNRLRLPAMPCEMSVVSIHVGG